MLDARVAVTMMDKVIADKFQEALENEEDGTGFDDTDGAGAPPQAKKAKLDDDALDSNKASDENSDDDDYKCRICNLTFPAAWSLTVHNRTKHYEKSHACSVCGRR